MGLQSAAAASPCCGIALFQRLPSQCYSHFLGRVKTCPMSASFYVKSSTTGSFSEPPKLKRQLDCAVKKISEFLPNSVQNFPWKKAESNTMQQLIVFGQKTLKWSLIVIFILSFSCDILYTISRNKELLVPPGLFFGCLTADFLKETSQDFLRSKEAGRDWHPLGISYFFILVRIIAIYFSGQSFLLHTANGGLMQVLWHWLSSPQHEGNDGTDVNAEEASANSK